MLNKVTSERFSCREEVRLRPSQKHEYEQAARLGGYRNLSEFMRASSDENAEKILAKSDILELSRKDREMFVQSLLDPPAPNKNLKEAAKQYKKLTKR